MIKKTILLVTALMIAASSATYAAKAKSIKVTNESDKTYFYKVGNTIKKISPGSTKSFPLKGLNKVKITAGETKSGNSVKGDKKTFPTLTIAEARKDPFIQTNPATGQNTPDVK